MWQGCKRGENCSSVFLTLTASGVGINPSGTHENGPDGKVNMQRCPLWAWNVFPPSPLREEKISKWDLLSNVIRFTLNAVSLCSRISVKAPLTTRIKKPDRYKREKQGSRVFEPCGLREPQRWKVLV